MHVCKSCAKYDAEASNVRMAVHGMAHHCLLALSNITQLQLASHSLSTFIIIVCHLLVMTFMHSAACTRLCNLQISRYSMTRLQCQQLNMQAPPSFASQAEGSPQQPSVRNSGLSLKVPLHDESPCGSMLHSHAQSHGPVAVESTHSCLLHAAPSSPAQAERGMSQETAMPGRIGASVLAAPWMQMQRQYMCAWCLICGFCTSCTSLRSHAQMLQNDVWLLMFKQHQFDRTVRL